MNLTFVMSSLTKDLRRRLNDPWALALSLGMPLAVAALLLLAFGGGGGRTPVARVLVVDRDSSLVSDFVMNALGRSPTIDPERVADSTAARATLDDGEATALIVIPAGFGQSVLESRPVTLPVITNPAQRILPGMVTSMLEVLADAGFYVQRLFGDELRIMAAGPPGGADAFEDAAIADLSTSINRRVARVRGALFPPLIAIETRVDTTRSAAQEGGFGALFFPGILFMALLFMASGFAADVWVEKERGTLRRMVSTPQRMQDFLAGKVLAGGVLLAAVAAVALAFGVAAFGVPWSAAPGALLWCAFTGMAFLMLFTLIVVHASSARTAGVLSNMILFPLLMVGGSFFPFEAMPAFLARIGRMTPNGWALQQLKAILSGTAEPAALAAAFAGLLAFALLAFLICSARLRGGFARS